MRLKFRLFVGEVITAYISSKVPRFILLDKKGTLVQLTFISSDSYCCTYELNWRGRFFALKKSDIISVI
jgi:hypothetical protein